MKLLLTEGQIKRLIEKEVELDELRRSYMSYITQKAKEVTGKEWPEYVLRDWLYKHTKNEDWGNDVHARTIIDDQFNLFIKEYGEGEWVEKTITVNINIFTPRIQQIISHRITTMGENPYDVENDVERFDTQRDLLSKTNEVSNEPIILIQTDNGFELFEGWHRTITYLLEYEEYEQNAYIYVPNRLSNVA